MTGTGCDDWFDGDCERVATIGQGRSLKYVFLSVALCGANDVACLSDM